MSSLLNPLWMRFHAFDVVIRDSQCVLTTSADSNGDELGILDKFTAGQLMSLRDMKELVFEAVMTTTDLENCGKGRKVILDTCVNVIGPEALFDDVGKTLEGVDASLQHPLWISQPLRYINPHWYYGLGQEPTDLRHMIGPRIDPEVSRVSKIVEAALLSLDAPVSRNLLSSWDADGDKSAPNLGRLRTELKT